MDNRIYSHGIDVTDAGTFQEKYFIVVAGLLEKQLEALKIIQAALTQNPRTGRGSGEPVYGEAISGPVTSQQNSDPSRKSRRS